MASLTPADVRFYRRWILANCWSEAVGLGSALVLGWLIAPFAGAATSSLLIIAGALAAVALGVLLEGVVVGGAQGAVLRSRLAALSPRSWLLATCLGAGVAWLLGMIPSTVMALEPPKVPAVPAPEPGALVVYPLAAALGLVAGPILGLAQWIVLRRHVRRAGRWLWANALAWAAGMPLIFLGMDWVPWNGHPGAIVPSVYAVCAATGALVGSIHGWILMRLVRSPRAESPAA